MFLMTIIFLFQTLNLTVNWGTLRRTRSHGLTSFEIQHNNFFSGEGGAEVTYHWSDKRGIMVILRRARPPASAPNSNESWLALAGFVSNQLPGGQFDQKDLQSQPAGNTACEYWQYLWQYTREWLGTIQSVCFFLLKLCIIFNLPDCELSRPWGRQASTSLSLLSCGFQWRW